MERRSIVGLVLAAGASSRMGPERNKLTEAVAGRPLVAGPVDAMHAAGIDPVFVVIGHEAEAIRASLHDRECQFIHHEGWKAGMGSSLATGVRWILDSIEPAGILVSVGDLPDLRPEWIVSLLEAFEEADSLDCLCVPTFRDRMGHPVLFGASHFAVLCELEGDRGGRAILDGNAEHVRRIEIENEAILIDLDTPADFDAWGGPQS
jgi:molybdenum cofactor cytidylyltransferase